MAAAAAAAAGAMGRAPSPRKPSRASAIAFALTKRAAGSGLSARRSIASRTGGTFGRTAETSGGGAEMRAIATAAALSPSQGRRPESSS